MKKAILLAALLCACGPEQSNMVNTTRVDMSMPPDLTGAICAVPPSDADGDGISDATEGASESPSRDTDMDGKPDYLDSDSDDDGIPDSVEGRTGGPCGTPADSDQDGTPDYRDRDSDSATNTTIPDKDEAGTTPVKPLDTDQDGKPDYMDEDNDGDGILDAVELTPRGAVEPARTPSTAPDTDGDGRPDYLDVDADGDTILDEHEGAVDTDGDLVGNYRDFDSDGDCIPDLFEAGDPDPLSLPVDTDGDGSPDFLDRDSDNDGLTDDVEDKSCNGTLDACEADRKRADTDNDGVSDLVERQACLAQPAGQQGACACDPANPAASPLTRGDFVFIVDYQKAPSPSLQTLDLATDVSQADVLFAIDSTASMGGAIANLSQNLADYVQRIKAKVPNVAFGVLEFRDFGDPFVVRYDHRIQTVSTAAGLSSVQTALLGLSAAGGGDYPEAGWLALYALAGGGPLTVTANGSVYQSPLVPSTTAPLQPTPGEAQGTLAGAGFRAGSVPIVVTVTDAAWHDRPGTPTNGEAGLFNYGPMTDCTDTECNKAPSRQMAIQELQKIGARVIGLAGVGGMAQPDGDAKQRARATAQDTGAVVTPADFGSVMERPVGCAIGQCCTGLGGVGEAPGGTSSCPLSYTFNNVDGTGASDSVVSGIAALASGLKFDIHVEATDVDPGAVDRFLLKLVPNLSGAGPASLCLTSTPSPLQDNFSGPKAAVGQDGIAETFPGIGGGRRICFDVFPKTNQAVMNTDQPQLFRARLQVKGVTAGNAVNLGQPREVFFLVPPVIKNGPIK